MNANIEDKPAKYAPGDFTVDMFGDLHIIRDAIPNGNGGWDYRTKDGSFFKETELFPKFS